MSQKIDGNLPVSSTLRSSGVSKASASSANTSTPVAPASTSDSLRLTGQATSLQSIQRELSQAPAVDSGRVQAVKTSLQDGSYTIDAGNIANRMLELDSQLAA